MGEQCILMVDKSLQIESDSCLTGKRDVGKINLNFSSCCDSSWTIGSDAGFLLAKTVEMRKVFIFAKHFKVHFLL